MDLKESKRTLHIPQTICKEFDERAVDMDIVLPDYCPEMTAVLKCILLPVISSAYQSGDRYTVDGTVKVRVLYLSEDRSTVHCYEATQPFTAGFRCTGAIHYTLEAKTDYVNCRAVSPRRMDVHGAFRVYLHAVGEGTTDVFADPDTRDVFCRKETVYTTVPVSESNKILNVSDTIHLGMQADTLLYSDVTVASCERKVLTNKAIIKGVLLLKAVMLKDGQLQHATQEMPFSQIVDADGLSEQLLCETNIYVGEHECYIQQTETNASLLFVNVKLNICLQCSRRESSCVVLDAYSVDRPLVCETTPLHLYDQGETTSKRITLRESCTLPDGLKSIEDQWGEIKTYELHEEDNGKQMNCCILVCMIGRNVDGQLGYYERTIDCKSVCDFDVNDADIRLIEIGCVAEGNQIRVQADVEMLYRSADTKVLHVVSDIAVDEKRTYLHTGGAIRIVYACEGDSLWNIAKEHHSSVDDIRAENDLTDDYIRTATMLMIPMI